MPVMSTAPSTRLPGRPQSLRKPAPPSIQPPDPSRRTAPRLSSPRKLTNSPPRLSLKPASRLPPATATATATSTAAATPPPASPTTATTTSAITAARTTGSTTATASTSSSRPRSADSATGQPPARTRTPAVTNDASRRYPPSSSRLVMGGTQGQGVAGVVSTGTKAPVLPVHRRTKSTVPVTGTGPGTGSGTGVTAATPSLRKTSGGASVGATSSTTASSSTSTTAPVRRTKPRAMTVSRAPTTSGTTTTTTGLSSRGPNAGSVLASRKESSATAPSFAKRDISAPSTYGNRKESGSSSSSTSTRKESSGAPSLASRKEINAIPSIMSRKDSVSSLASRKDINAMSSMVARKDSVSSLASRREREVPTASSHPMGLRQRPNFNILQQHYSPAKLQSQSQSPAPKTLTSTYPTPPAPSKTPANANPGASAETNRHQNELLLLHILHQDAVVADQQWRESARAALSERFRQLRIDSDELATAESDRTDALNVTALKAWGAAAGSGGNGALETKVQMLDGILLGLWNMSETGGKYSRVVRKFERWADRMSEVEEARDCGDGNAMLQDGEVIMVGALDKAWRDECMTLGRRLDDWRRQLISIGSVGINMEAPTGQTSSLERILSGCAILIRDMLTELAVMEQIENEAIRREEEWMRDMLEDDTNENSHQTGAIWRVI